MPLTTERKVRCRYVRRDGNPCANEALDDAYDSLIALCAKHALKATQMLAEMKAKHLAARKAG